MPKRIVASIQHIGHRVVESIWRLGRATRFFHTGTAQIGYEPAPFWPGHQGIVFYRCAIADHYRGIRFVCGHGAGFARL